MVYLAIERHNVFRPRLLHDLGVALNAHQGHAKYRHNNADQPKNLSGGEQVRQQEQSSEYLNGC